MGEGEGGVCLTVSYKTKMEIESRLRIGLNCDQDCVRDVIGSEMYMKEGMKDTHRDSEIRLCAREVTESDMYMKEEVKDMYNDIEIRPCTPVEIIDVCNELRTSTARQETEVGFDNMQLDTPADNQTDEVPQSTMLQPLLKNSVKDIPSNTELKPCSGIKVGEVGNFVKLEPSVGANVEEVVSLELEPLDKSSENKLMNLHSVLHLVKEAANDKEEKPDEVMEDEEIEPENRALEVSNNGNSELFYCINKVQEAPNDFGLDPCPRNKVKEASNDDMHSEVSNPNLSPNNGLVVDLLGVDHGGCGEITSAYSQNLSVRESLCKEENCQDHKIEPVSASSVVLEIPKHISTTGIRKITLKFSKRKEEYADKVPVAVKPASDNDSHEEYYENPVYVSGAHALTNGGFVNYERSSFGNAELNLRVNCSELHDTHSHLSCYQNGELKMSNKIFPDNYPTNVKKLLSTRIFEGAWVKYISKSKEKEISGIIKDCGYLCGCSVCNFSKVVGAYEFELHAGTKTRHPNNHIYLENGKPIYRILEELRTVRLSKLDDAIKSIAGSSVNEECFQVWKENLQRGNALAYSGGVHQSKHLSSTSYPVRQTEDNTYSASCHNSQFTPYNQQSYLEASVERKCLIKKPRHYYSTSAWDKKKSAEGGSRKRDNELHKVLFMPDGLPDGTELAYYAKGKKILGGHKQGNGILCSCCNTEISPSQFESHAGCAAKRQPYRHIYTSSGLALHDIALMLANGQKLMTSSHDDMCAVCGDGKELITCHGCPRAFHAACLGLHSLPVNDWCCPYCRDKFGSGEKASGPSISIIMRFTKATKEPEFESGGCVVCRSQEFSAATFDDKTVILCDQCEKEYHIGCLRESGLCDLKELPDDRWFCCDDCNKIFTTLQHLASSGPEVIPASVSNALYKKHATIGLNNRFNSEIKWCILSGKSRFPEQLFLLSRAAEIFRECFDPIIAASGRDLIPVMVYGRNISGQEFSGMYCVVLTVKTIVVSTALLRIFGREIAELPLVATSRTNQGKGYFQALFRCIERFLLSMNVKRMVLPAAEDAEPMWTKKLGFKKMSYEQMQKYTRDNQLAMFKGTSLLEKEVQLFTE